MREEILIVKDCFAIKDRGTVVVGNSNSNYQDLDIGTTVIIVRPDRSEVETIIRGKNVFGNQTKCFGDNNESINIALLLGDVTKDDVSVNSLILKK